MAERGGQGRSLFSRIAWTVVLGFLLLHVLTFYFYGHERMVQNARTFATGIADRALALDELLVTQPDLLPLLQYEGFTVQRVDRVPVRPDRHWPHNDEITSTVHQHLEARGVARVDDVAMWYLIRGGSRFVMFFPSVQGGFLEIVAATNVTRSGYGSSAGATVSLFLLLVVGFVLYTTRRSTRQLSRFAVAAEQLGSGSAADPLPEKVGPRELRRASAAFNRMQEKVLGLLEERSGMLAGISHDLRTLATRLNLRLEEITDEDKRALAQRDIEVMTGILDQALTFARDEHSDEDFVDVDVGSLLESLVHDAEDAGHTVSFTGEQVSPVRAQRMGVTRLFANLLDNAIKYGGSATVSFSREGVRIADPGPGFDPEQAQVAVQPYVRLDGGRSQNIPGSGLGLAIAENVCRRHGWELRFERDDGGFVAAVVF